MVQLTRLPETQLLPDADVIFHGRAISFGTTSVLQDQIAESVNVWPNSEVMPSLPGLVEKYKLQARKMSQVLRSFLKFTNYK